MQHDATARLVLMANQIARNMKARGEEKAIKATAGHISRFWERRMRERILQHVAEGGEGLDDIALRALKMVKLPDKSPDPLN